LQYRPGVATNGWLLAQAGLLKHFCLKPVQRLFVYRRFLSLLRCNQCFEVFSAALDIHPALNFNLADIYPLHAKACLFAKADRDWLC
jgi:hypothetical protein